MPTESGTYTYCRFRFPVANRHPAELRFRRFSALLDEGVFPLCRGGSENRTIVQFLRWAKLLEIAEPPVGACTRQYAVTRLRSVWLSSQTDAAYR
jgi:hypothetical protein